MKFRPYLNSPEMLEIVPVLLHKGVFLDARSFWKGQVVGVTRELALDLIKRERAEFLPKGDKRVPIYSMKVA